MPRPNGPRQKPKGPKAPGQVPQASGPKAQRPRANLRVEDLYIINYIINIKNHCHKVPLKIIYP
jgi:hypothetical protein